MKAPRHWPLCGDFTGDGWIPRTNGQLRGKCFHLMTSSSLVDTHYGMIMFMHIDPLVNVSPLICCLILILWIISAPINSMQIWSIWIALQIPCDHAVVVGLFRIPRLCLVSSKNYHCWRFHGSAWCWASSSVGLLFLCTNVLPCFSFCSKIPKIYHQLTESAVRSVCLREDIIIKTILGFVRKLGWKMCHPLKHLLAWLKIRCFKLMEPNNSNRAA